MSDTTAIIVAAGKSERMKGVDKQLALIGDMSVLEMSVAAFASCESVGEIIISVSEDKLEAVGGFCKRFNAKKPCRVCAGGKTRQQSVFNAISNMSGENSMIAVHDGARPLVSPQCIEMVIKDARVFGAAVLGVPVKDTIKVCDGGFVKDTPPRSALYITQTPQVFKKRTYFEGIDFALEHNLDFTDDCQLVEAIGAKVYMSAGDYRNIKITTPEDLTIARAIADNSECGEEKMRIGHGYDVHRFAPNRRLILGGAEIPYERGLLGHSDADVLVHAIMDAILGAMSFGDIGKHFPDNDERFKNAFSINLLEQVGIIAAQNGFVVGNIDSTLIMQAPKVAPFIEQMRSNIASALGINTELVSVKATTEEGLGFTGTGEGVAAHCVCILRKKS